MRCDILAFLCLFLAPFLTIAQADRRKTMLPWKFTIAGSTDSITVDEILSAGKLECSHKAFEIIDFTLAAGGDCLKDGLYAGANCPSLPFTASARQLIRRLRPGKHLYMDKIRIRSRSGLPGGATKLLHAPEIIAKTAHQARAGSNIFGLLQLWKSFCTLNQYIT